MARNGRFDESLREIEIALRLDPESYEVNNAAGVLELPRRGGSAMRSLL